VIGVGHPAEERAPLTEDDAEHRKVHYELYQS
jgi:hypothetical protein